MTTEQGQWWRFLRALPFMPVFQISIAGMVPGLYLAMWFYGEYIDASPMSSQERLFGVLYVVTVSMSLITYFCYKSFLNAPPSPAQAKRQLTIEIVTTIPLVAAAIVAMYFLSAGEISVVNVVLWPGIIMRLVLRFILYKRGSK